jgi:hypothetical protein
MRYDIDPAADALSMVHPNWNKALLDEAELLAWFDAAAHRLLDRYAVLATEPRSPLRRANFTIATVLLASYTLGSGIHAMSAGGVNHEDAR